ncbi:aminoglycoside phosphotransferase family protein [Pelagibius sp. Alg239-R121]|uniref:aminoglycoside phosphotransferase family protein n=1 Tax=Pelagibius sp. Alg239-R121 TaxID=2993448 RepID=UPI0024A747A8|nr:aminoglycoside phosphotransferase family protein [Pelagibius sp. Alg239-R121]
MTVTAHLPALLAKLQEVDGFSTTNLQSLRPLEVKGLAHDHVEVADHGVLLRVPKQSQFAMAASDNLSYQAACFRRVSESGHAPKLEAVIEPCESVPMGALLVEMIDGRPPSLPKDLGAMAECMAKVHALELPDSENRPPLANHRDPVAGAMAEIGQQAEFLDSAELSDKARREIEEELAWARDFASDCRDRLQPQTLVLTDTHPGNFLIDKEGRAIIVDLEKALYGSPGTDLAHATIYSSTTWDTDVWADLSIDEVAGYYQRYLETIPDGLAESLRPWMVPLRRITMLRAITWCAKWRVLQNRSRTHDKHKAASTEDWSAENNTAELIAHVAGRVDEYLQAETLQRMRAEWLGTPSLYDFL